MCQCVSTTRPIVQSTEKFLSYDVPMYNEILVSLDLGEINQSQELLESFKSFIFYNTNIILLEYFFMNPLILLFFKIFFYIFLYEKNNLFLD